MTIRLAVLLEPAANALFAVERFLQARLLVHQDVDSQQVAPDLVLVLSVSDDAVVFALNRIRAVVLVLDVGHELGHDHARNLLFGEQRFGLVDRFGRAVLTHTGTPRRSRRFLTSWRCMEAIEGPETTGKSSCLALTAVMRASSFMGMLTRLISSRSTLFSLRTECTSSNSWSSGI